MDDNSNPIQPLTVAQWNEFEDPSDGAHLTPEELISSFLGSYLILPNEVLVACLHQAEGQDLPSEKALVHWADLYAESSIGSDSDGDE